VYLIDSNCIIVPISRKLKLERLKLRLVYIGEMGNGRRGGRDLKLD
jgi:hypothetical protein